MGPGRKYEKIVETSEVPLKASLCICNGAWSKRRDLENRNSSSFIFAMQYSCY